MCVSFGLDRLSSQPLQIMPLICSFSFRFDCLSTAESTAPLNMVHARCPHCGRIFRGQRSSLSLEEHISSIHAVAVPTSKAHMASSPSSIRSSDAVLSPIEPPLVCSKCKASFTEKDHLEKHQLLHSSQAQVSRVLINLFAVTHKYFLSPSLLTKSVERVRPQRGIGKVKMEDFTKYL